MDNRSIYELWLKKTVNDIEMQQELNSIANDDAAINDRFYSELEFGTAGLRGVLGAGTNRMNIYNIRHATQGLANYLLQKNGKHAVAIAYDSRIKSDDFAKEAACVLAANGIKVYIYAELMPTPMLSFAVRKLQCSSGIVITASHNPSDYNGYKCYGSDGCQMTDHDAGLVFNEIKKVNIFENVKSGQFDAFLKSGTISYIEQYVVSDYMRLVEQQSINPDVNKKAELKVLYTPLNGTGNSPVRAILDIVGHENVAVVKEQERPDGKFTTCPRPNPELRETYKLALETADETKPDIILATDPDCDRVGAMVRHNDEYIFLSGNEMGGLLTKYILSGRKEKGSLPEKPVLITTVVTSRLAEKIAISYGCEVIKVLTGFKYIGEQITLLQKKNEDNRFIFGFEESYGYLAGTHARDKDAVVTSMLICEMASYYKLQEKSLCDALNDIYSEYGLYVNEIKNYSFNGETGMNHMAKLMDSLRLSPPLQVAGKKVLKITDYKFSFEKDYVLNKCTEIKLPSSNVLSFELEDNCEFSIRPSGTEPKLKIYVTAVGDDTKSLNEVIQRIISDAEVFILKE